MLSTTPSGNFVESVAETMVSQARSRISKHEDPRIPPQDPLRSMGEQTEAAPRRSNRPQAVERSTTSGFVFTVALNSARTLIVSPQRVKIAGTE